MLIKKNGTSLPFIAVRLCVISLLTIAYATSAYADGEDLPPAVNTAAQKATAATAETVKVEITAPSDQVNPAVNSAITKAGTDMSSTVAKSADPVDSTVSVLVTEKIPGANCVPVEEAGNGITTRKYRCTVKGGFAIVVQMLGGLIKYATFITALLGVLMIVFSGLQYATSAGDTKAQKTAVTRIGKLIGGLILLFLMALVLNTVAPWIYG